MAARADESSDDDDLFDNLRKMRENNAENVINKSSGTEPNNEITRNRKRIRSDSESENSGRKMQKIDEGDENSDDDILSFAKKTLQQELPDSEDIMINIPTMNSGNVSYIKYFYLKLRKFQTIYFCYSAAILQ